MGMDSSEKSPVRKEREGRDGASESWRVLEPHTPSAPEVISCIHVLGLILHPLRVASVGWANYSP